MWRVKKQATRMTVQTERTAQQKQKQLSEMKAQIIDILTEDLMLEKIAKIVAHFLRATWFMDSAERILSIQKQRFEIPLQNLLISTLFEKFGVHFVRDDLDYVSHYIVKKFSDIEKNNLLSEKLFKDTMYNPFLASEDSEGKYQTGSVFTMGSFFYSMKKMTKETITALAGEPESFNLNKGDQELLLGTITMRINFMRECTNNPHPGFYDPRGYINEIINNRTQKRLFVVHFLGLVILVCGIFAYMKSLLRYEYAPAFPFLLIACGLLAHYTSAYQCKFYQEKGYDNEYLTKQILSKILLESLTEFNEHRINSDAQFFALVVPKIKRSEVKNEVSVPELSEYTVSDDVNSNNTKPKNKEAGKEIADEKGYKQSKEKITKKKQEIEQSIVTYVAEKLKRPKITWEVKEPDQSVHLVIYYPFKEMNKVIELWTGNVGKLHLNGHHYIYWEEDKIKEVIKKELNRNSDVAYNAFYSVAQRGKIANPVDDQGFVDCSGYKNAKWKVKVFDKDYKAFRMFFGKIAEIQDAGDKSLYRILSFSKEH